MNNDLYDNLDYNSITDVFIITDMTIKEEKSNYNLLNVDMLSQMLPFSEILEKATNKPTYKTYLNLMKHFIGKAFLEKKYSILKTFGDFLKGISFQRIVLYYLVKLLYLSSTKVFYSHNHFIYILSELLEQQFKRLNSERSMNAPTINETEDSNEIQKSTASTSARELIKSKKLTCLLILSFLDMFDAWQFPQDNNTIKLHSLFSETKATLSIYKSIISSCFTGLSNQDKYKFAISPSTEIGDSYKWEKNNRKVIYYIGICINLFVSNSINSNERYLIISFIINCLDSLVLLFTNKDYAELLEVLFVGNNTITQIFFHHCIEEGFELANFELYIYFSYQLITNSQDHFLFHFLLDECYNPKAEKFIDMALPLIGNQITNTFFFTINIITLSNLIKWTILVYHLASSLRKDLLIQKEFELLQKLFDQLHKSFLLYTKIEVNMEINGEVHKKLIAELVFELVINLYGTISEDNQKKLLLLFDTVFFIQNDKSNVYTIFYCIDTQMIFQSNINLPKEEIKGKIKELEANVLKSYSRNEINITIFFLIKAIIYKMNLCQTEEEITDEVLNTKMNKLTQSLIDNVILMKSSKVKNIFKDSKINQKLMMKTKETFEMYSQQSNKYHLIETDIIKYFYSNLEPNEEAKYMYIKVFPKEKIKIGSLLNSYDQKYQVYNINYKLNASEENKGKPIKGSHNSSNSLLKGEINAIDKYETVKAVDFKSVNFSGFILNTKKHYLLTVFASSFHNIFFKNDQFLNLQRTFINMFDVDKSTKKMRFPSKLKNFTNGIYPPLFLKQNMNFFADTFFDITHEYYKPYVERNKISMIPFTKKRIRHEGITESMQVELITLEHAFYGEILLEKEYLLFESGSSSNDPRLINSSRSLNFLFSSLKSDVYYGNKQLFIFFKSIKEVLVRRFLLMNQAVEIYLKNGKSYFFNLFKREHLNKFIRELRVKYDGAIIEDGGKEFYSRGFTKAWQNNEISSFTYLSLLNKYSSRTFRDTNQYPVFPWLLYSFQDFFSSTPLDETTYRNFNYPITIRNTEKQQIVIEKFQENRYTTSFGYHFGCHYSTGPFIYYYLMRLSPFTQLMIKLQNNELESANRMFISFEDTLKILEKTDDNREAIPQFFSMFELFLNVNCLDLKKRKTNNQVLQVDNIELPHPDITLATYANFVLKHLQLLNSNQIKKRLPMWIDNIFGINQLNCKEDSCIIFPKYTYEKRLDLEIKLENIKKKSNNCKEITSKMIDKIQMVINFGQTPTQILRETCFKKNEDELEKNKKTTTIIMNKTTFEKGIIYFNLDKNSETLFLLKSTRNIDFIHLPSMKRKSGFPCKRFELSFKKKHYSISKGKYICIPMKAYSLFIFCRYLDQSMKIFNKENCQSEILCEDFVCSLAAMDDESFFSGLQNGKLIHWALVSQNTNWVCKQKRYIMAHDSPIYAICVNKSHNIIISSAKEDTIYIRKLYDLELISVIMNQDNLFALDIKVSVCNYVYILYYNDSKDAFVLKGYSLNGLNFAASEEGKYINFEITQSGNIIIGEFIKGKISILSGGTLAKISEFNHENKGVKKVESKNLSWFKYTSKEHNLYLLYSNGDFVSFENVVNYNSAFA